MAFFGITPLTVAGGCRGEYSYYSSGNAGCSKIKIGKARAMLYLSLVLIAAGLVLILFPVVFRTEKRRVVPVSDRYVPNFDYADDGNGTQHEAPPVPERARTIADDDSFEATHLREYDEAPADGSSPVGEAGILDEMEMHVSDQVRGDAEPKDAQPATRVHQAVLYEDSSSVIDYDTGSTEIDPTLGEYKKLKRVGRGMIDVVKDGINFHLGKSFYRFDFYKVERAKTGANFIALYLKGSTVVRLFLFEEPAHQDSDIRKSIEEYFNAAG